MGLAIKGPGSVAEGGSSGRPLLCLIGCAAPPVLHLVGVVEAARAAGWDTGVVLTPTAARWLAEECATLARATGHPVRSEYTLPGQVPPLPAADAVLVVPATANSLNKCAAGISDTLALGLMNEAIGRQVPLVAVACLTHDLLHPALPASVAILRGAGVELLGVDRPQQEPFGWEEGLALVSRIHAQRSPPQPR